MVNTTHELINGVESEYSAEPKVWIFSESGRIYGLDIEAVFPAVHCRWNRGTMILH